MFLSFRVCVRSKEWVHEDFNRLLSFFQFSLFDTNSNNSQTAEDKQWIKDKKSTTPNTTTTTTSKNVKMMNKKMQEMIEWINKHKQSVYTPRVFMFFDACSFVFCRCCLSCISLLCWWERSTFTRIHTQTHKQLFKCRRSLFLAQSFIRLSTNRNVKSLCTNTLTHARTHSGTNAAQYSNPTRISNDLRCCTISFVVEFSLDLCGGVPPLLPSHQPCIRIIYSVDIFLLQLIHRT